MVRALLFATCGAFILLASTDVRASPPNMTRRDPDMVFGWVREIFSATPQIVILPRAIPELSGHAFFSRDEVIAATARLAPEDAKLIEEKLVQVDSTRAQEEEWGRVQTMLEAGSAGQIILGRRELFYRNPLTGLPDTDVIGRAAEEGRAIYFDYVTLLVDNRLYKQSTAAFNRSTLPTGMASFVDQEFTLLAGKLSKDNRSKAAGCHLTFSHSDSDAIVWMQSMTDSKPAQCQYKIVMSPVLVRAIFADTVKNQVETLLAYPSFPAKRREDVATSILERFTTRLDFILAHELGHIVIHAFGNIHPQDEECCDDIAQILASRVGNGDVGAFKSLLVAAIQQGAGRLWAVETTAGATEVISRLKSLEARRSIGARACNVMP